MRDAFVKAFLPPRINCAVVLALIALVLVSQALAVLRPVVPTKPVPPLDGELIIIGDDPVMSVQENACVL
jgi:hypothetical protein